MSKNMVEIEGPQMTSQYGSYVLYAGLAKLHACVRMHIPMCLGTHMHACNTYCFSTSSSVALQLFVSPGFP